MAKSTKIKLPENSAGVIFAGGYGTRLWPISTKTAPKQVNTTFDKETLMVKAFNRALKVWPRERIYIVTTRDLKPAVEKLVKLEPENILVQPENADTAMAEGYAAAYLNKTMPGSVAVTLYSDHLVTNLEVFFKTIKQAIKVAEEKRVLVTIGTFPSYPSPDFGYIKLADKVKSFRGDVFIVDKFIEKPSVNKAKRMIADKKYVWNTGLYIWQPEVLLDIFRTKAKDIYKILDDLGDSIGTSRHLQELKKAYHQVRRESFDEAVSERTKRLMAVVADIHWKDVGNWKTVYELTDKDQHKNAILSFKDNQVASIDSSGCLVIPTQSKIALVGVKDLLIAQSENGLLICDKGQAAKVKLAAKQLES